MAYTRTKVLKYTLLPEVLPRIGKLFGTGFYHIAYLIAVIFQSVRLLPSRHPYLDPNNLGRFGVRHVIAEASNNLKMSRGNIDQIVIFFTILLGLVLLIFQFGIIFMSVVTQPVFAGANFFDWFIIPSANYAWDEERDIALMVLDRVFGVGPDGSGNHLFDTCVARAIPCVNHLTFSVAQPGTFPYPIHLALHQLFRMYSIGISIISLMIIFYFIVTVVGETAVSGTPFGQRFNRVWAPVRLLLFFALIAPLNTGNPGREGLNGAQLITLYTAKFGSNFATNAWGVFNTTTSRTYYQPEELIAIPNVPDVSYLAQFWTVVNACVEAERIANNAIVKPYLVIDNATSSVPFYTPSPTSPPPNTGGNVTLTPPPPPPPPATPPAAPVSNTARDLATYMDFTQAIRFTNYGDLKIVIGIHDDQLFSNYRGNVYPLCGEITIPVTAPGDFGALAASSMFWDINYGYQNIINPNIPGLNADIINMSECYVYRNLVNIYEDCNPVDPYADYGDLIQNHISNLGTFIGGDAAATPPTTGELDNVIDAAITNDFAISDELMQRGWAGAAIWYNRIAQYNGALVTALNAIPQIAKWPIIMEQVKDQQQEHSPTAIGSQLFSIELPPTEEEPVSQLVELSGPQSMEIARTYYELYKIWEDNNITTNPDTAMVQNPILDTINVIFGADGLFDMRRPPTAGVFANPQGNPGVHPLALLSSLGRSLIEAAIRNLGVAAGGTLGGGLMQILGAGGSSGAVALQTATSFAGTVASTIIMIGVMLYYVLPFMPFIYFFFALGGWVKSIFEAMVAMPIWALAHIRIDGDGLPGPGASNGYYLLLEIFIRPVLILAGLIGSIVIFGAMVQVLNQIFDLMVSNTSGAPRETGDVAFVNFYRGPIDELFFSIMYAAIVYMTGLSCFKLIDSVPNNILRWMGVSVSTFQENADDQVGKISQSIYQKGNVTVGQISGFTQNNSGAVAAMLGR